MPETLFLPIMNLLNTQGGLISPIRNPRSFLSQGFPFVHVLKERVFLKSCLLQGIVNKIEAEKSKLLKCNLSDNSFCVKRFIRKL
jgi:hypothetical protein